MLFEVKKQKEARMHISVGQMTIADLVGQLERKELIINRDYQREAGVWPDSARTYFIDTILEGYPFPKIYLYQTFSEKTKKPLREVVDGQQRITTISDFLYGKFKLTASSKNYARMTYLDLDEEKQQAFQMYLIETSLILSATRAELLEMFRRINAYTAPLSAAEKRHSIYQGEMKWFIVEQADEFSEIFEKMNILSAKQLARMGDAEAIADMIAALEYGVVPKATKYIDGLYKNHDVTFNKAAEYHLILKDFFDFLSGPLSVLSNTFIMKSYVIHSLFSAYTLIKYGLPVGEANFGLQPNSRLEINLDKVIPKLHELAYAHEQQDETGKYGVYVKSCLSSTTKLPQRLVRVEILANVLLS